MLKTYFFKDFCDIAEFGFDDSAYFVIEMPNLKLKTDIGRKMSKFSDNFDAVDLTIETAEKLVKEVYLKPLDDSEEIKTLDDLGCCAISEEFFKFFSELIQHGFKPKKKLTS